MGVWTARAAAGAGEGGEPRRRSVCWRCFGEVKADGQAAAAVGVAFVKKAGRAGHKMAACCAFERLTERANAADLAPG